ncbi:LOW QUALITY PROTEIN: hypothetical protein JCM24511_00433 [Saitozyma sp. JCM 24511]|nr:LOW QUALITY PROTEIN: hypothetical protein JCM24511_00433 [Saitozyma sp. JCM 24511]
MPYFTYWLRADLSVIYRRVLLVVHLADERADGVSARTMRHDERGHEECPGPKCTKDTKSYAAPRAVGVGIGVKGKSEPFYAKSCGPGRLWKDDKDHAKKIPAGYGPNARHEQDTTPAQP